MSLSQGHHSISHYTIEFWSLAAEVDWTEDALGAPYTRDLSESIKDEFLSMILQIWIHESLCAIDWSLFPQVQINTTKHQVQDLCSYL